MECDAEVFVVDDDSAVSESLVMVIEPMGHAVRRFSSAEEFLADFDYSQFGCALVDVRLPGMSGVELHEQLASADVPVAVILMTGHARIESEIAAMRKRPFGFFEKPCSPEVLIRLVREGLEHGCKMRR